MLGKTHICAGVASSLVVLHPASIPGILCAAAGGAVGGWISDIDCRTSDVREGAAVSGLFAALIVVAALAVDYVIGNGIYLYIRSHFGMQTILGMVVFLGCCAYGAITSHRTFTHSFLAMALMGGSLYLVYAPIALPFVIGFASHLLLDLTNRRGMQLFFPFKKKFCLSLCDADGPADMAVRILSFIIAVLMIAVLTILSITKDDLIYEMLDILLDRGILWGMDAFELYLVGINLVTFLLSFVEHTICRLTNHKPGGAYDQEILHVVLNFLSLLGGGLGVLLSLILFRHNLGKYTSGWYTMSVSFLVAWIAVYLIACDPFSLGFDNWDSSLMGHIPLTVYLLAINALGFILFFRSQPKQRSKKHISDTLLFMTGLCGGTVGGLILMFVTGHKRNSPNFAYGFPILFAGQICIIAYLMVCGIA